jgi:catechol 2,3-dioxygenase-like lactoylglutathione lyase family enzyme
MITGAHAILYSKNADADRAFLRDVLGFPHVDVGGGWLVFGLPPSEVAVHPGSKNDVHEFYLMVDDVEAFVRDMTARKLVCDAVQNQGWGLLTSVTMPGGGKLGVYQPRHARPANPAGKSAPKKGAAARAKKKPAAAKAKPAAKKKPARR